MKRTTVSLLLLLAGMISVAGVQAGIIASATRVIFTEGENEKSLMLVNTNSYPILVQTWVDKGEVNVATELSRSPFITLPSVFTLQANAARGLRIIYTRQPLPIDRESVFWLNLYEIPPTPKATPPEQVSVMMAMNTQMKIFYRPKALSGDASRGALSFVVKKQGKHYVLACYNRSAFYVSFARLSIHTGGRDYPVVTENDMMTAPYSTKAYQLDNLDESFQGGEGTVNAAIINDQGYALKTQYPIML
ncbi:fimbrial biogenesis chaperone [Serratia fonticola]|uniref:fimbrial biogenesis chaperone n=1 Tax=Serratia fonticola TaxID=47917 RepID=UPI00093E0FBF|nr:molecular chaperone [Serratia fonticola]OKP16860.1 pilus assembly protein [Serratia fonticola]